MRAAPRLMPTPPTQYLRPLAALALCGVFGLIASGCGTENVDKARGRVLFIQKCGQCHTLAQAATTGVQGPNLDNAFAQARADGEDQDTIAGVIKSQVEFPRPSTELSNPAVSMPPDLVTGSDLNDVAAYVGSVAGIPGIGPPKVPGGPGAQVFANNGCGGCHTLAAAKSGGTTGPDLDKVLPGQSAAEIEQSIVDPEAKITPGYPANVMPANFKSAIPPDMLKQLVDYLISSTSGKKG
jgi:mono/diheme cytochrome c family protein